MKFECKKAASEGLAMVCLLAAAGCQDYEADWTLEEIEQREFIKSGIFNFATSGDVTINLDYNAPGATNPVWIYTEYPFDDEGDLKEDVDAEFAFFLEDGKFQGTMNLPTSADRLYIVTGGIGLPMVLSAAVVNGAVELYYDVNEETRGTMANATLTTSYYHYYKANNDLPYSIINPGTGHAYYGFYDSLYALYHWNTYGMPNDVTTNPWTSLAYNNVKDDILNGVISRLQSTLWHGQGSKALAKKKFNT